MENFSSAFFYNFLFYVAYLPLLCKLLQDWDFVRLNATADCPVRGACLQMACSEVSIALIPDEIVSFPARKPGFSRSLSL